MSKKLGESMALSAGTNAYGCRFLKEGFGFDSNEDLEWALGWPHVRYVADTKPERHDGRPHGVFDEWQLVLPRATAIRIMRGYHHRPEDRADAGKTTKAVRAQINRTTPLERDEVAQIVRLHMRVDSEWYLPSRFSTLLLVAEALVGTEAVVEPMVEALEAFRVNDLKKDFQTLHRAVLELGFMLLRLPASRHAEIVKRLEAVFEKTGKTPPMLAKGKPCTQIFRALDLILHGKKAVTRSADGAPFGLASQSSLLYVHDDPAFVRAKAEKSDDPGGLEPESRLTFVGGEEILDLEQRWMDDYVWPQSKADVQRILVDHYARIRSPRIVPHMVRLSKKGGGKRHALRWLAEHADFARPHLKALARSGDGLRLS